MDRLVEIVLMNALSATLLAALAAVISARTRSTTLAHAVWLLVLLKLVSPPVIELGAIPSRDSVAALTAAFLTPAELETTALGTSGQEGRLARNLPVSTTALAAPSLPTRVRWPTAQNVFLALTAAGAVALSLLALIRLVRFRRGLRFTRAASPELVDRVASVARKLGLSRPPRVRLTEEDVSPSLWPGPGRCEILLPARLLTRLSSHELDMLLAHELAHVRRRDHWIRPLELLVGALYWWHPVAWWARRNLRTAEEKACDALVIESFPGRARAYADGMLKTLEFLSRSTSPIPPLATGAAATSHLKERLTMILTEKSPPPLRARGRVVLLAVALIALLISPTWIGHAAVRAEEESPMDRYEERFREQMQGFRRQELELEKALHELQNRKMQVELQLQEAALEHEIGVLRSDAEALRVAGEGEAAKRLERELVKMEKRAAVQRSRAEFEKHQRIVEAEIAFKLQELQLEREDRIAAGEEFEAAELRRQELEIEAQLQAMQFEAMKRQLDQSMAELEIEMMDLEDAQRDE